MLMVEVHVPSMGATYQCSLEEDAEICDVIEDIIDLIHQKENVTFHGDIREILFCSQEQGIIFDRTSTLSNYGVSFGEELLLI